MVRLVSAAFQAAVLLYLARLLGPGEFGGFAATLAFGGVAATVLGLGGRAQALRVLAVDDPPANAATLLLIRFVTAVVACFLALVVARLGFGVGWALTLAATAYVASDSLAVLVQSLLLGLRRTRRANVAILVRPAVPLAAIGVAVSLDGSPVVAFAAGSAISAVVSVCLVLPSLRGFTRLGRVLRESYPFWAATSLVSLQQLDVTIITAAGAPSLGGNFGAAQRVVNPLNLGVSSVLSIVTPELSQTRDVARRGVTFYRTRRAVAMIAAAFILLAPLAYIVGPWLLGPGYSGAGPVFGALCIMLAINALTQVYAAAFYAFGYARRLSRLRLATVPVYLLLALVGATLFDEWGLGVALIVGRLIEVAVMHFSYVQLSD